MVKFWVTPTGSIHLQLLPANISTTIFQIFLVLFTAANNISVMIQFAFRTSALRL